MTGRRKPTPRKARAEAIARTNGLCAIPGCGQPIVDVDHIVAHWLTQDDSPENLRGLCWPHHREKTTADVRMIAKAKRMGRKHRGEIKAKRTIRSAGFRGWRKFNGEVTWRTSPQ